MGPFLRLRIGLVTLLALAIAPATYPAYSPSPPVTPPVVTRLRTQGILFYEGDRPWRWKGVTGFALYRRYLNGEDIAPYLAWAQSRGFNIVRVFGAFTMNASDAALWLDPRKYGERYFTSVGPFLDIAASRGLRVEWVALADQQCGDNRLCFTLAESRALVARVSPILARHANVTVEIANEPPFNGVDPKHFLDLARAPGLLVASGNYDYDGTGPLANVRDYITTHDGRDDQWPGRGKESARALGVTGARRMPAAKVPIVGDEPIGAAEQAISGRRSAVASDFRDYARVESLYAAGATFHYDLGMQGQPPPPGSKQDLAAIAFVEGLDETVIPPLAPTWTYTAGHLGDCPLEHRDALALRTYCMTNGGRAICVIVRKTAAHRPVARNGWRVVSATPDGGVVTLAR